jgi:hypothetical protein
MQDVEAAVGKDYARASATRNRHTRDQAIAI